MSGSRQRALNLYRSILRLHRNKLPEVMRNLGDAYVREEFRRHKAAKPEFLVQFFSEWESYVSTLQAQQSAGKDSIGQDLPSRDVAKLTDEQRAQLDALRAETEKAFKPVSDDDLDKLLTRHG